MLGQATNQMLEQAEQGIQAKVPQEQQAALEKVIHAGLTIMYSPNSAQGRNQMIANSKDPAQEAAQGSARLVSNLYQQSGKKIPVSIIMPAAAIFALEYLDLVAKAGKTQITPDLIANTTQSVADTVLPMMGITKDKLAALIKQSQQGQGDPSDPSPSGIINRAQGAV